MLLKGRGLRNSPEAAAFQVMEGKSPSTLLNLLEHPSNHTFKIILDWILRTGDGVFSAFHFTTEDANRVVRLLQES
jgi:hypothetical protein